MTYHVIWSTGIIFVTLLPGGNLDFKILEAYCPSHESVDGLSTLNCTNQLDDAVVWIFPKQPPYGSSIKIIDLTNSRTLSLSGSPFQYYKNVQRIIIRRNAFVTTVDVNNFAEYEYLFFQCTELEVLIYTESYLTDIYQWHLPKKLKTYIVDRNEYKHLDLHLCPAVEEISANHNKMENVPILSNPQPPLRILRLVNNPMHNLTAEDIALLCSLKVLELSFPPDSLLTKAEKYCECKKIEAWTKERNITGTTDFMCSQHKQTCPTNFLEKSRELYHKTCDSKKEAKSGLPWGLNMFLLLLTLLFILVIGTFMILAVKYLITAARERDESEKDESEKGEPERTELEVEEEIEYEETVVGDNN